jgi:hypothetical protein
MASQQYARKKHWEDCKPIYDGLAQKFVEDVAAILRTAGLPMHGSKITSLKLVSAAWDVCLERQGLSPAKLDVPLVPASSSSTSSVHPLSFEEVLGCIEEIDRDPTDGSSNAATLVSEAQAPSEARRTTDVIASLLAPTAASDKGHTSTSLAAQEEATHEDSSVACFSFPPDGHNSIDPTSESVQIEGSGISATSSLSSGIAGPTLDNLVPDPDLLRSVREALASHNMVLSWPLQSKHLGVLIKHHFSLYGALKRACRLINQAAWDAFEAEHGKFEDQPDAIGKVVLVFDGVVCKTLFDTEEAAIAAWNIVSHSARWKPQAPLISKIGADDHVALISY